METTFKVIDFNVSDRETYDDNNETETKFQIQMFGINEKRETVSIFVNSFNPFFYVKVNDSFDKKKKKKFLEFIKMQVGERYEKDILKCTILKKQDLYGFTGGKNQTFVMLEFQNTYSFNKTKNLWYYYPKNVSTLNPCGLQFEDYSTFIYESNIPPLLRFFHIQEISPSGWVTFQTCHVKETKIRRTTCDHEFSIDYNNVLPVKTCENRVPYKICSFDIEASSSHGDFPVPVKSYKKLSTNIVESTEFLNRNEIVKQLKDMILTAFGFGSYDGIDLVFPKKPIIYEVLEIKFNDLISKNIFVNASTKSNVQTIEELFERMNREEEESEELYTTRTKSSCKTKVHNVFDLLCDASIERNEKINVLNLHMQNVFPKLKGDQVTFIGSTFMNFGEESPYKNHCVVLNSCDDVKLADTTIESYATEKEVLLAWTQLIQKEDPDIIIGYNIFGFDYQFLFNRAKETQCLQDFLKLSRNKDEICATRDRITGEFGMEQSTLQIASGQHDLNYIKMNGRLQIDLYNYFRREENLTSYKLDSVAGHFIGDYVCSVTTQCNTSTVSTSNMTGLVADSYVHFEIIGHSVDYINDGAKYKVLTIDKSKNTFDVTGVIHLDKTKKCRWCLAKDDVTPKDIFKLSNESSRGRSIIAKYCIQDCNLVHYLFNKVDILTGFIEMATICSVPINFLIFRGQGIKLTSYIAKKCREKNTLMPVVQKSLLDDGYEGAIVLPPKCDLYLDNPVACVDYASLYPSSMISENLSHDSKVWTKEYNLNNEIIEEWGEKDKKGNYTYDNLENYKYVNVTYDTYRYVKKNASSAAVKVKCGTKICRFAQFPSGNAIMPSILEELLRARKSTRKLILQETDDFMKNILDKRQLGYKLTANSLYGQCGAKTSTFYEKDIAACTTAIGRLLLTYAKRIIEDCYADNVCETQSGSVRTKAEYIYGDTDSVFFTFNLEALDGTPIRGKQALAITIELAQEAGNLASTFLKGPHELEYEKTFMPFCLLSKKRYVGMLYETDVNKCKRKEMGIVLKRRDNAPIVKDIYGGIIDILMKDQDIQKAIDFLNGSLQNIVEEKYPLDKLVITKSLRSGYKNPKSIAHKVLADRIGDREPGNKPAPGDRIPYVYIASGTKKCLQGDKIETPNFIVENKLKIDYSFYITNQIMKPVQQLFALVLEKIWDLKKQKAKHSTFKKEVNKMRRETECDKQENKLENMRNAEIKKMLFDSYLRKTTNDKNGFQTITKFFK